MLSQLGNLGSWVALPPSRIKYVNSRIKEYENLSYSHCIAGLSSTERLYLVITTCLKRQKKSSPNWNATDNSPYEKCGDVRRASLHCTTPHCDHTADLRINGQSERPTIQDQVHVPKLIMKSFTHLDRAFSSPFVIEPEGSLWVSLAGRGLQVIPSGKRCTYEATTYTRVRWTKWPRKCD